MVSNKSRDFILEFFKDSKLVDEKGVLNISEVPKDFEDFVGKKSPYKLVFDFNLHNKIKDSELITQGSYFLLSIRDYLINKGQTSLLKINIKPDLLELNKNLAKGSRILEIKQADFNFLSEFYFLSIYQYLNEKKQSMNNILIKDNNVIDLDINKFKSCNGNKEEIPIIDLNKSYLVAKIKLNKEQTNEISKLKLILIEKLDKELFRVKDHYYKQIKEKDEEVETCARKIKLLETKLKHTYYDRDISILKRQIRESKERLEGLKKKGYRERLRSEELFHITDEVEKHVLSIKNNLINVTVYYYPVYDISVSLKGKISSMKYDPVFNRVI
jgi:hypothetical protein